MGKTLTRTLDAAAPPIGRGPDSPQRQRILEAAITCFSRAGFHASSMQEICAEAQMSPGALYRHFPSKDAIIEAIADIDRTRSREILAPLDGDHADYLEAFLDVGFSYLREMAATPRKNLCGEVLLEAQRNDRIRDIYERNNTEGRDAIRTALKRARDQGRVDASLDLEIATTVLMALGDGLMLRAPFETAMPLDRIEPALRDLIRRMLAPRGSTPKSDNPEPQGRELEPSCEKQSESRS